MTTDVPSPAGVSVICAFSIGSPVSSATTWPLTDFGGRDKFREGDWASVSPIALTARAAVMKRVMAVLDDIHTCPVWLGCTSITMTTSIHPRAVSTP